MLFGDSAGLILSRVFHTVRRQTVSFRRHKLPPSPDAFGSRGIRFTLRLKPQIVDYETQCKSDSRHMKASYTTETEFIN